MPRLFGKVMTNKNIQRGNNNTSNPNQKIRIKFGKCNCGK